MKLTPRQLRAIGVYATQNRLRLSLSTPPIIYFSEPRGGMVAKHIDHIVAFYDNHRKEAAKERARAKRLTA